MELSSKDFNRALAVYLEWGPARLTPVSQRIAAAVPGLTEEDVTECIRLFGEIRHLAFELVAEGVRAHTDEPTMRAAVAAIDERVSEENASFMYTEARVSAWKDGEG